MMPARDGEQTVHAEYACVNLTLCVAKRSMFGVR
jgi:hypothetical protein